MRDGYVIGAWNTNVGVIDSSSAFVEANEAVESFVVVAVTTKHAPVVVLVTHDVDVADKPVAGADDRRDVHLHRARVTLVIHCSRQAHARCGSQSGFHARRAAYYLLQGGYVIVVVCLSVSNFAQKLPNGFA